MERGISIKVLSPLRDPLISALTQQGTKKGTEHTLYPRLEAVSFRELTFLVMVMVLQKGVRLKPLLLPIKYAGLHFVVVSVRMQTS